MKRIWIFFFFICCLSICGAKEYRDTLWTVDNDRIILKYDVRYSGNEVVVRFLEVRKKLGYKNAKKYTNLEDVDVVFFDRTGGYGDVVFTNMIPEAIMVPSNLKYAKSEFGYFFLHTVPSLSFKIIGNNMQKLSIPLYLSYYEGKGERKLFSVCDDFSISINGISRTKRGGDTPTIMETVTTVDPDEDNELAIQVATQVNTVYTLLEAQTKLPFSDGLQYEITCLRDLQKQVKDKYLVAKIKECLTNCELKSIELEERQSFEIKRSELEAEEKARAAAERERAYQDSVVCVQQKQAESDKKRNIWMIIGGGILAVVCFVGNLFFRHFSSMRSQRSMMEMQNDLVKRAEYEAKRHVGNYARKKANDAIYKTKKNAQEMVRNKIKNAGGKNSKNLSI